MSGLELDRLYFAIIDGKVGEAVATTQEAIAASVSPQLLLDEYMIPAMDEVGEQFAANECYVPELLLSARAMKAALAEIRPLLVGTVAKPVGCVVVATVQGDMHDIGKNLVATMLEGGGFQIVDIGVDVDADQLLDAVYAHKPDLVALSALLTTTLPSMKRLIEQLTRAGVREQVKVMVGGAPVTEGFALAIGADGYSDNAAGAVVLARRLLGIAAR
ncbi:MAG: corrinoid protein [Caldilineaceae bacterium]|nr:corrinoid protein [Caldilineaceae bacterium]